MTTLLGCNPSEGGNEDASTAAASTTGASDPQTGSTGQTATDPTGDPPATDSEPTTTPDPTTGPMTSTTASDTTQSSDPDTGSDTTGSTTESSSTSDSSTGGAAVTASATLEPKSRSQAMGSVLFTDVGGGIVDLVIEVSGVEPPGTHGLHIHEIPDCSAPDGTSTGNHWNPPPTMLGELGTIEIADDGTGIFMKSDMWSIGTGETNDVVAHSIIIHAEANGGTRIACGVIAKD